MRTKPEESSSDDDADPRKEIVHQTPTAEKKVLNDTLVSKLKQCYLYIYLLWRNRGMILLRCLCVYAWISKIIGIRNLNNIIFLALCVSKLTHPVKSGLSGFETTAMELLSLISLFIY